MKYINSKLFTKLINIGFAIFLILASQLTMAQVVVVSGIVTDANSGEVLPGASVSVKGSPMGTISDANGQYKLSVANDEILVFSFIGYKSQEVTISGRSTLDVALSEDIEQLSEIVVVGYGQVDKKDVTGAVASVSTKEFNQGIITSPERLLAGKVAGVQITTNGGEPGGNSDIRIRGASSLAANSDPLIVIDGVAMNSEKVSGGRNPLNFINPADIENITVLKDASASAIYGSRAAGGVIIVQTKTGQSGKLSVAYNGFYSISTFVSKTPNFSADQYRDLIDLKAPQEYNSLGKHNTDWVKEITRPATGLKQMLSVSGGTKNHRIYGSVNYLKNEGVLKTSENKTTNISLKYNGNLLNDNLKVTLSGKYGLTKDRFAPNEMGTALFYDPTRPVRIDSEETGGYFQWKNSLAARNPVATINLIENTGDTDRFLGNAEIEYQIPFVKGLSIKGHASTDVANGTSKNLTPLLAKIYTSEAASDSGRYNLYEDTRKSKLLEIYGTYKTDLEKLDAKIEIMAGYSWQNFTFDQKGIEVIKLGDSFDKNNFRKGTKLDKKDSVVNEENRLISFFGRANFHIKDRYLMTLNIRRDGSTKFGPDNRWGIFPSVALGWRIIDEPWAEFLNKPFSDLKLRIGYGVIGNERIGNFLYLPLYTQGDIRAQYQFGYDDKLNPQFVATQRPTAVDPQIKWEETVTTNIGMDFGLLGGRLYGSIDYYIKKTSDLLSEIVFPAGSVPGDKLTTNIGEMENKGIELLLNSTVIDKEDFNLSLTFNAAHNTNKISKLDNTREGIPDSVRTIYRVGGISGDIGQTIQRLQVGLPINTFETYQLDPNGVKSGGVGYRDVNGDGIINEKDRISDKSPDPKWLMGLTTNLRYKSWDLGFTFRANIGNYVYNNVASSTGYFERLTDKVTNNVHQSALKNNFDKHQLFADIYVENASFLKLDNVTLGYSKQLKPINLRVYTTFQNVLTMTGYSGIDPEVFNGIDNNLYPRSLTMLFGVNITY